jgi:hypothetical protein
MGGLIFNYCMSKGFMEGKWIVFLVVAVAAFGVLALLASNQAGNKSTFAYVVKGCAETENGQAVRMGGSETTLTPQQRAGA